MLLEKTRKIEGPRIGGSLNSVGSEKLPEDFENHPDPASHFKNIHLRQSRGEPRS